MSANEWETKDADISGRSSPFVLHNQKSKDLYCQRALPDPTSLPSEEKQQNLSYWPETCQYLPSMMLQTWGQMAKSNVYFCASFQIALARPDGILCLLGINENLKGATALPEAINSTSFQAHSFPKLGCPFPWWWISDWKSTREEKSPWKMSLWK